MNKTILNCIVIFTTIFSCFAQEKNIPIGTWRVHANYSNATCFEITPTRIYVGTKGGLFYVDKATNEQKKILVTDGLSDLSITSMKYSANYNTLIIAYQTGAVDLIKNDNEIISILDIKKLNRTGSKKINDISLLRNFAFLASDFGGILIDLVKNEIKESYLNIGENGSSLNVFASTTKGDSIFIATSQGLLCTRYSSNSNLMDFNSWRNMSVTGAKSPIHDVALKNNFIIASINNKAYYSNEFGAWNSFLGNNFASKLVETNGAVYALIPKAILKINSSNVDSLKGNYTEQPTDFKIEANGKMWHTDLANSLVDYNQNMSNKISINSTNSNTPFKTINIDDVMLIMGGGHKINGEGLGRFDGFSIFKDGNWNNFFPGYNIPFVANFSDATYDKDRKKMYYAVPSTGVMIQEIDITEPWKGASTMVVINDTTKCKILERYPGGGGGPSVVSVNYSKEEDVTWVASHVKDTCIYKLKDNGECESFRFCDYVKGLDGVTLTTGSTACRFPSQIIVDEYKNKWVRLFYLTGSGIILFNEEGGKNDAGFPLNSIFLTEGEGKGNLPSSLISAMAKDLKGDIWVGTNKGVTVFYNNGNYLSKDSDGKFNNISDAKVPRYEGYPLLFEVNIKCIEVDGANRKWIGTDNGVYLFSEDGSRQIRFFNTANSPLLSNSIVDIKVNKRSGEVFINTDVGLFSYRGDATEGLEEAPNEIHIFPNPMKRDYEGTVGFTELGTNAKVKIIDMAGQLVHEMTANGGMATWNGKSYTGEKITPGVYVVLTSKDDGEVAVSGKLFVTE